MASEPQAPRLALQLGLGCARARHHEPHIAAAADDRGERVERKVKALLVDQPAHQKDEALLRRGEARAQEVQIGLARVELGRIDAIRDRGDPGGPHAEHAGDVAAHELRAGDHVVGAPHHRPLGSVDLRLRVVLDPALMAAVFRCVDGDEPRPARAPGHTLGGAGHEPVVRVHDVELETVAQLGGQGEHVGVHGPDPAQEGIDVGRELGLAHAVDVDAVALLVSGQPAAGPGEHVDLHAVLHQML